MGSVCQGVFYAVPWRGFTVNIFHNKGKKLFQCVEGSWTGCKKLFEGKEAAKLLVFILVMGNIQENLEVFVVIRIDSASGSGTVTVAGFIKNIRMGGYVQRMMAAEAGKVAQNNITVPLIGKGVLETIVEKSIDSFLVDKITIAV